jgi:hypothetical protein
MDYKMEPQNSAIILKQGFCRRNIYSTPSPFAGVTFLKTPANGKTAIHEVKIYAKYGVKGTKDTQNMILNMYN